MKGIELPISTLIIIVVCIAVLIAVIMFFFGGYNQGTKAVNLETARSTSCQKLASMSCNQEPQRIQVVEFDADKDGTMNNGGMGVAACDGTAAGDNLANLCKCYYGINIADLADTAGMESCKKQVCNC